MSISYCLECCIKHGQTAKVLMREALQRAEADGSESNGVKEKVRGVVEELSGMEDDTNTYGDNEDVRKINSEARAVRKFIYESGAEIGGADMKAFREIRKRLNDLVELSYSAREKCSTCKEGNASLPKKDEEEKAKDDTYGDAYEQVIEKRKRLIESIKKEREGV